MAAAARLVLVMAARNVVAYRRRNLQTFVVVFFGVLGIAVLDAFMNGFGDRLVASFAVADGHLRVTAPGYAERRALCPLDRLVASPAALGAAAGEAALAAPAGRRGPGFAKVTALPILRVPGVVQRGERTVDLYAAGAEAWLPGDGLAPPFRAARLLAGRWPGPGERGMVLAAAEARRLGASPGESLILLASDAWGSFGAVELPLLGITAAVPGPAACLVDPGSMRGLLGAGDEASELALYLVDGSGAPVDPRGAAPAVAAMAAAMEASGLEAEAWDSGSNIAGSLLGFFDVFFVAMYLIFVVVAGAGIANSVYLSVQDRIRDLGTLRAIAFTARRAQALVAAEILIVGLAASLAAAGLACLLVLSFGPEGIALPATTRGIAPWMPERVPARLEAASLAAIVALGSLLPLLAAAWPLHMLRKMRVREALAWL